MPSISTICVIFSIIPFSRGLSTVCVDLLPQKMGRTRAIRRQSRIAQAAKPPPRICRAKCGISACAPHREKALSDPKKREELSHETRRFATFAGSAKHTKAAAPADEGFSLSRRALCAFPKLYFISHKLAAFNFIAIFHRLSNAALLTLYKLPHTALRCFAAPRRLTSTFSGEGNTAPSLPRAVQHNSRTPRTYRCSTVRIPNIYRAYGDIPLRRHAVPAASLRLFHERSGARRQGHIPQADISDKTACS